MTSLEPMLFPVLLDAATDPLVRAVAAYLARYRGQTRVDTESDLRDVQIAARHADPRTTMRYDRARKNLDRHPNQLHPRRLHGLRHLTEGLLRAYIFRYTIFSW